MRMLISISHVLTPIWPIQWKWCLCVRMFVYCAKCCSMHFFYEQLFIICLQSQCACVCVRVCDHEMNTIETQLASIGYELFQWNKIGMHGDLCGKLCVQNTHVQIARHGISSNHHSNSSSSVNALFQNDFRFFLFCSVQLCTLTASLLFDRLWERVCIKTK